MDDDLKPDGNDERDSTLTQGDELRRLKTSRVSKHPRSATTGALRSVDENGTKYNNGCPEK